MAKKRSNRWEFSFAAGTPQGRRSQVWKIWSQSGSCDVYIRTIRGEDMKISLHDPMRAVDSRPWNIAMTPEYMDKYNDASRNPDRAIVRWGPFRTPLSRLLPAVQIVIPESELRIAPDAPPSAASADYWLFPVPEGQAARFVVMFAPTAANAQGVTPGSLLTKHSLPDGRDVLVVSTTSELEAREEHTMESWRARGIANFYADLSAGRLGAEQVGSGPRTFVALHALPPIGHLVTVLEFHALSFHAMQAASSADLRASV